MTDLLLKNPLNSIQTWLEAIEINNPAIAQRICQLIPAQCPFERKIYFRGRLIAYIPPLCKLNPFYRQFILLRLKAMSCLALTTDC